MRRMCLKNRRFDRKSETKSASAGTKQRLTVLDDAVMLSRTKTFHVQTYTRERSVGKNPDFSVRAKFTNLITYIYFLCICLQLFLLIAFIFAQLYSSFYSPPHLPFFFAVTFIGCFLLIVFYLFFLFSLDRMYDTYNWYLLVSTFMSIDTGRRVESFSDEVLPSPSPSPTPIRSQ